MRLSITRYISVPVFGLLAPLAASAQTPSVSTVVGLFNIAVGLMFVAAFATFVGGLITYFIHFGNQERLEGIHLMEWGVAILFTLTVLLGAARFFQSHPAVTNVISAAVIMIIVAVLAFTFLTEEAPPPKREGGGGGASGA